MSRRRSSEAALYTAQENLSWTQLVAPAAGVVTQVSAEPGQVLSAGQRVMTIALSGGRDAVIDVADPQAFSGSAGRFRVSLLADPSVSATGSLRDISPQADAHTRTWRVRVTLDNPPPGHGARRQRTGQTGGDRACRDAFARQCSDTDAGQAGGICCG